MQISTSQALKFDEAFEIIFERELALLVALHVASIWKVDPNTVRQQKLGNPVCAPAAKARSGAPELGVLGVTPTGGCYSTPNIS